MSNKVNLHTADHAVPLAPEGHDQAYKAGKILANSILERDYPYIKVLMLVSPYKRTQQTAIALKKALFEAGIEPTWRECLQLREQSFGLFDGLDAEQLQEIYPRQYELYQKHKEFEGEFFAPMPMGESRARVCDRVRSVFGSMMRDFAGVEGIPATDIICVSHGVTIRCAIMEFLHWSWDWCEKEPNPANCAIKTISGAENRGWKLSETFSGFPHPRDPEHEVQELREHGHVA